MDLVKLSANELAAKFQIREIKLKELQDKVKELQAAGRKITSELDDMRQEIREGMEKNGITKIESDDKVILFRLDQPSGIVSVEDESEVPEKFFRVKKELDKVAIKKAIQTGDDVPGASLKKGKSRLTVRLG